MPVEPTYPNTSVVVLSWALYNRLLNVVADCYIHMRSPATSGAIESPGTNTTTAGVPRSQTTAPSPGTSYMYPSPLPNCAFRARAYQGSPVESPRRTLSQCTPRASPVEAYVHLLWKTHNLGPWGQKQATARRPRRHTHHLAGTPLIRK